LMAAAGEMKGARRLAGGRKQVQVDAGEFTSAFDWERWINQAFLGLVLGGVVVTSEGPHRTKDRAIAGTATEIAPEDVLDFLLGGGRLLLQEGVRIHDETRRAEPALGAVMRRDAVLGRVQPFVNVTNALGGRHHHAIDRAQGP